MTSTNYPAGAENDPLAPYNQEDCPEVTEADWCAVAPDFSDCHEMATIQGFDALDKDELYALYIEYRAKVYSKAYEVKINDTI
jgi:hypothetical protein